MSKSSIKLPNTFSFNITHSMSGRWNRRNSNNFSGIRIKLSFRFLFVFLGSPFILSEIETWAYFYSLFLNVKSRYNLTCINILFFRFLESNTALLKISQDFPLGRKITMPNAELGVCFCPLVETVAVGVGLCLAGLLLKKS